MRLSTKSTYGVRAMVDLARHAGRKGAVTIAEIAEREEISTPYLEQLLNKLRRQELIKSVRGPHGGYVLAKSPRRITVGDIVRILEGDTAPVTCVAGSRGGAIRCRRSDGCATKGVWEKLARAIDGVLDSVSLEDLAQTGLSALASRRSRGKPRGVGKRGGS